MNITFILLYADFKMDKFESFLRNLNETCKSIEGICKDKISNESINNIVNIISGRESEVSDEELYYSYYLYCTRVLKVWYENNPAMFEYRLSYSRNKINSLDYELNSDHLDEHLPDVLFYIVMLLIEFLIVSPTYGMTESIKEKDYIECVPMIQNRISEISLISSRLFKYGVNRLSYLGFGLMIDINRKRIDEINNAFNDIDNSGVRKLLEDVVESDRQINSCLSMQSAFLGEIHIINERLKDHKSQFNFALLGEAFVNMKKAKEKEKVYAYVRLWGAIVLLLSIPLILICLNFGKKLSFDLDNILYYIPFLTLEVILFYIMRLFYLEVGSVKAQILQIDMRLSLCEFIHDYIEKRENSDKTTGSWGKFESLIFSPIQMSADNIPSLLDGANAVADVLGKVMPKK